MDWIRRTLRPQIRETHLGVALVVCLLTLSAMSIALLWQAQIIANQREVIRWLAHLKLGS